MTWSRRSVVQTCGAMIGTAAVGGSAGCSGLTGEGSEADDGSESGQEDTTSDTWYTSRLPAPDALGYSHYEFSYVAVSDIWEQHDALGMDDTVNYSIPGIALADIDHFLSVAGDVIGGPAVYLFDGSFDPSEYEERGATVRGLSEQGSMEGYTLWGAGSSARYALGAKQGSVVQGFDDEGDPLEAVQTAIDTANGEVPSYPSSDGACGELVDTLGGATSVVGQRHEPSDDLGGAIGEGATVDFGADQTTVAISVVFEEQSAVSPGAVSTWAEGTWAFESVDADDVETNGSIATVEGTTPTGEVSELSIDLPQARSTTRSQTVTPTTSFGYSYEEDSPQGSERRDGTLTITHQGGDVIKADQLSVRGTGFANGDDVDQVSSGTWQGSSTGEIDGAPAVQARDSVTVAVASDYVIRVFWFGESSSAVLSSDRGPDA